MWLPWQHWLYSYVCIKECRPAANLQHNLCVIFAIKFSIGSKLKVLGIVIPCENLGEANNFFPTGRLGKFCYTGGLSPKG